MLCVCACVYVYVCVCVYALCACMVTGQAWPGANHLSPIVYVHVYSVCVWGGGGGGRECECVWSLIKTFSNFDTDHKHRCWFSGLQCG